MSLVLPTAAHHGAAPSVKVSSQPATTVAATAASAPNASGSTSISAPQAASTAQSPATQVLTPAQWARQVLGVTAPFGHDGLPTVLG